MSRHLKVFGATPTYAFSIYVIVNKQKILNCKLIGNDEVGSSILPCSTSFSPCFIDQFFTTRENDTTLDTTTDTTPYHNGSPMSKRLLGWEDYPSPRIVLVKGKLSVEVSVPRAIRHLFGSGQGGVTNRRSSTGTTDPVLAEKKKMQLAHEIYKEFDLKQIDAEVKEAVKYDDFARTAITDLAKALKYNRSVIPRLDTATKYSDLEEMKRRLDEAVKINDDDLPERHKRISAEFQVMPIMAIIPPPATP